MKKNPPAPSATGKGGTAAGSELFSDEQPHYHLAIEGAIGSDWSVVDAGVWTIGLVPVLHDPVDHGRPKRTLLLPSPIDVASERFRTFIQV